MSAIQIGWIEYYIAITSIINYRKYGKLILLNGQLGIHHFRNEWTSIIFLNSSPDFTVLWDSQKPLCKNHWIMVENEGSIDEMKTKVAAWKKKEITGFHGEKKLGEIVIHM